VIDQAYLPCAAARSTRQTGAGKTLPCAFSRMLNHPSTSSKSQVTAFFARYATGGIRTRHPPPLSARNLLYHCTPLLLVSILCFLSTYYTKLSVNWSFEALRIQIKKLSTKTFHNFRDLQLSFWLFSHPRSFTKFKIHFAVCQI